MDYINKLICGNTMEILKQLSNECIDTVMCSPPYWGLRFYGIDGQYGLENSPNEYIENMRKVFSEVYRILKKEGTCWINIGDTYCSQPAGSLGGIFKDRPSKQAAMEAYNIRKKRFDKQKYGGKNSIESGRGRNGDFKEKCMLMMPERFAFMMINLGFILRNKICWNKPNAMPSSVKDRFTCTWEYVYFFSKSRRYYFDLDNVRIPLKQVSIDRMTRTILNNEKVVFKNTAPCFTHPLGRNPGDHWVISTKGFKGAHFAVYPEELCRIPILSSCPKNGIVLDPFCGSGTTCVVAKKLGRNYCGIDFNPDYIAISEKRLLNTQGSFL